MMAQQYATDEAGNVWDVSGPTPVFVSAAAGAPTAVAPNQLKVQAAQQDLSNDQLSGRRTAQQIALEAARVPVAAQVAQADASKATADAERARLEVDALRKKSAATAYDPAAGLQRAINDMRARYKAGPGATSGIAGALDFLPTEANKNFDKAASTARGYVGPALGLTASQLNTPGEIEAAIGGYIPKSSDYDSNIVAAFDRLQGLANDQRKRAGYTGPVDMGTYGSASPADQHRQNDPRMATIGNAGPPSGGNPQGPRGYDVGGVAGGVGAPRPGGGGGFSNAAGLEMAQRLSKAYTAGADVSALNKILRENGYQEFTDPQSIAAIQRRGPLNFAPPQVDDSRSGLGRAIGDNLNNGVGAYAVGAADALTAGNLDTLGGGQTKLAQQYLEKNNPTASLLGTVTGGALAAGGAELGLARAGLSAGRAALAGDALYGGAYGAGSADGGNRLLGALAGATGGAVGGIAGRGVAAGAGRVARGVQNADVAALREAGIPTTVGQTLGGVTKSIEDRLSGLPGIDVLVNARRREGIEALRPAAVRTAVDGIPGSVTATDGRTAIEQGRQAVGDAYDNALGGVNLTIDPTYKRELGAALQGANSLPGPLRDTFTSTLENRVSPQFNGQTLDGRGLQGAVQGLRKDSGDLIRRNEIQSDLFADRATDVEEALFNLAERQAPGTPDALIAANRANRGLSIVEEASARAMNNGGDFTAAQLGQSIRQNARRFNGIKAMNSGKAPLQALQEAAQNVLPNAVPDSGTVGRSVVAGGLGLLGSGSIGGGAGYATGGDVGAGAGTGLALAALLAAGGTKTGQKALVKALADRPDALVQFGNKVIRGSKYGGIFGAPLVAPIATGIVAQ